MLSPLRRQVVLRSTGGVAETRNAQNPGRFSTHQYWRIKIGNRKVNPPFHGRVLMVLTPPYPTLNREPIGGGPFYLWHSQPNLIEDAARFQRSYTAESLSTADRPTFGCPHKTVRRPKYGSGLLLHFYSLYTRTDLPFPCASMMDIYDP
ncbi:hypothetical protein ONZ45_g11595 [Pleurotus djamor]|nr:hypothetical protein ONZ45_g11595 [Pleurotus djamor]